MSEIFIGVPGSGQHLAVPGGGVAIVVVIAGHTMRVGHAVALAAVDGWVVGFLVLNGFAVFFHWVTNAVFKASGVFKKYWDVMT